MAATLIVFEFRVTDTAIHAPPMQIKAAAGLTVAFCIAYQNS